MLTLYLSLIDGENDKEKFEKIYKNYSALMLSRAYEILHDSSLAEDAAHNAFVRILKNIDKLDDSGSLKTKSYVMIVLENTAKTMYVKRSRQKIYELDESVPNTVNVERETETKLTAEIVAEKIAELPEKYRDVIVLKFLNGLDDGEIASALGISRTAVRKRLQRSREKLRELMGGISFG